MSPSPNRTIVLAGATGLIGRPLVASLSAAGHRTVVLTRRPREARSLLPGADRVVRWDGETVDGAWARELEEAAGVVNLSGASVLAWPWTARRRRLIRTSRVRSTAALVDAMEALAPPSRPAVLVNSSGINFAGDLGDSPVGEDVPPGRSFLAGVAREWEEAARRADVLGVRVALMRTPLVLARGAPALRLAALPFRLFAGGPVGDGRQWVSWIHLDDAVALYRAALDRAELDGPVNVVAPDVRRQREVAREIGRILRRPARLRVPPAALRAALGAQAELFLHGQRAVPGKARAAGHAYRFPLLPQALEAVLEP